MIQYLVQHSVNQLSQKTLSFQLCLSIQHRQKKLQSCNHTLNVLIERWINQIVLKNATRNWMEAGREWERFTSRLLWMIHTIHHNDDQFPWFPIDSSSTGIWFHWIFKLKMERWGCCLTWFKQTPFSRRLPSFIHKTN